MKTKIPTLGAVIEKVGSTTKWPSNCFAVSTAIVNEGLVKGVAVYGHYLGPVHEASFFASRKHLGFQRHGWILLADGGILDPTRWVFEAKKPYLYVTAGSSKDYDEGGNRLRSLQQGLPPTPAVGEKRVVIPRQGADQMAFDWWRKQTPKSSHCGVREFWIASGNELTSGNASKDLRIQGAVFIRCGSWTEGKHMGPARNKAMLEDGAELVIAFPGGTGTENMIRQARRIGVTVLRVEK